jgi:hypothetical protein
VIEHIHPLAGKAELGRRLRARAHASVEHDREAFDRGWRERSSRGRRRVRDALLGVAA